MLLSDEMIRQQNALTVGLIAAAMCGKCDLADLDVFKGGRLSFDKYNALLDSLRLIFPKTVRELERTQGSPLHSFTPVRISQGLKIKDVSLLRRRDSKENFLLQGDN